MTKLAYKLFLLAGVGLSLLVLIIYLLPTIHGVLYSFELSGSDGRFGEPSLRWYDSLVSDQRLLGALGRSTLIALMASFFAVSCSISALYRYPEYTPRVKKAVIAILLLPLFIPETSIGISLSRLLAITGFGKGWVAVSLVEAVWVLPFAAIVLLLRIASIPGGVIRSAQDIGLSNWTFFWRIFAPMTWTSWVVAGLFAFIMAFNEYTRASYVSAREVYSTFLYGRLASGGNQAVYAAATLILIIGLALLALLGHRMIREIKDELN